jgi:hypothetical protein
MFYNGDAVETIREKITATVVPGFEIGWGGESAYVALVESFLYDFRGLISVGRASEALDLIEWTIRKLESNWDRVESDGILLPRLLLELQDYHLKACREVKPDPIELARHLFDWATTSEHRVFENAPKTHAEVLGIDGLNELGRLAAEGTALIPAEITADDRWKNGDRYELLKTWAEALNPRR